MDNSNRQRALNQRRVTHRKSDIDVPNEVALRTAPGDYQLHLLDTHGQIVWRQRFITGSDDDAITISMAFLRHRIDSTCGYELWHGTRYICCENDPLVVELGTVPPVKMMLSYAP